MENHINKFPARLWEGVKERFADVKSIKEYNSVREDLIEEWVKKYEGRTYNINVKGDIQTLPYYLHIVSALDSSGLVVELSKNFIHESVADNS